MAITRQINMNTIINESEIWKYFRGEFKGFTENIELAKRIMGWKRVKKDATYYYPDFSIKGYDFIFHTRTHNRVSKVLGLPERKKSLRRIKKDQRLQESDCIGHVKTSILSSEAVLK